MRLYRICLIVNQRKCVYHHYKKYVYSHYGKNETSKVHLLYLIHFYSVKQALNCWTANAPIIQMRYQHPCYTKTMISFRDRAWAEEKKMFAFLSVAAGAKEPPRFVEMQYNAKKMPLGT